MNGGRYRYISFGLVLMVACSVLAYPAVVSARSYEYSSINVTAEINEDTSVDVRERQTVLFTGEYKGLQRRISLDGISDITDVRVLNGETGEELIRSNGTLDPYAVADSAGKYTVYRDSGDVVVEWYHDSSDVERSWEIAYTAYGAISFHDEHDELYWDLFTDYEVPVRESRVDVVLPGRIHPNNIQSTLYKKPPSIESTKRMGRDQVSYLIGAAPAQADISVAVGFPKGNVDSAAFWSWWVTNNYGIILSVLIILAAIGIGIVRWYVTEKYNKGRGTVVPRYGPPHEYPPAVAEVLVNEHVSKRTWPATLVDLAVRGYIEIEEEVQSTWDTIKPYLASSIPLIAFIVFGGIMGMFFVGTLKALAIGAFAAFLLALVQFPWIIKKLREKAKDYRVMRTDKDDTDELYEYEQTFLNILFTSGFNLADDDAFSTKKLKKSPQRKSFAQAIRNLKNDLLEEVGTITGAYITPPKYDKYVGMLAVGLIFVAVFGIQLFGLLVAITALEFQFFLVIGTFLLSFAALYIFFRFETRLSDAGFVQREEWLGFKLYLETAEKYRLQDLTPETFQTYLPYAIAFKVEEMWAKAFEAFSITAPDWYHGSAGVGAMNSSGSGMGSFSPSGFSSSFASSFSSSFSSSSGSGASGGGGSAGGGAGGGGGGAF